MKIGTRETIEMLMDNKFAINLARNPITHGKSRHIETKYHFLRDQVNRSKIILTYYKTYDQVVDILTMPLKIEKFIEMSKSLKCIKSREFELRESIEL
jgi:hypothetical protein